MSQETVNGKLFDALQAAQGARDDLGDRALAEFLENRTVRQSIYWQLMIIGEALNQASRRSPNLRNHVPNLQDFVTLRHRIVHVYDDISDRLIWTTVRDDLPELIQRIEAILADRSEQKPPDGR